MTYVLAFPVEFCIRNALQARPVVQTAEFFLYDLLRNAFQLGLRRKVVSRLGLPCFAQLGYAASSDECGEWLVKIARFFFPFHGDTGVRTDSEPGLPALLLRELIFLQFTSVRPSVTHSTLTLPSMSRVLLRPPDFVVPPVYDGVRMFAGAKRRAIYVTIELG